MSTKETRARLSMRLDLIDEAEHPHEVSLNRSHAQGYVDALYDEGKLSADETSLHREDIEQRSKERLAALRDFTGVTRDGG